MNELHRDICGKWIVKAKALSVGMNGDNDITRTLFHCFTWFHELPLSGQFEL